MSKAHLVDLDGKLVCVKEYCHAKGISYSAVVCQKQRTDKTYEEILAEYENGSPFISTVYIDGKQVPVKEYCRENNISYDAVRAKKWRTGQSFEEIIQYYLDGNGRHKMLVNGKLVSIPDYCKHMGYSYDAIRSCRERYNISWEDAIEHHLAYGVENKRVAKDKRFYGIWNGMLDRCYDSKNNSYIHYGKKGIKVQESWHDYFNFEDDMYESYIKHVDEFGEKDTTIDRIDPNGNYELSNVRWATCKEQANNTSSNFMVTEDLTLAQFCDKYDLPYNTTRYRFVHGWDIERILNTPVQKKYRNNIH